LLPISLEMALAAAGHLAYPSAIRDKATAGISDVAAKWPVSSPALPFGMLFAMFRKFEVL
jgi:hypothetical protein